MHRGRCCVTVYVSGRDAAPEIKEHGMSEQTSTTERQSTGDAFLDAAYAGEVQHLTARTAKEAPVGTWTRDPIGDAWCKEEDGRWRLRGTRLVLAWRTRGGPGGER